MRNALVVVQVALALVLVVSAALMIRTFQALRDVDPGFSDPATIQTAQIWVPRSLSSAPGQVARVHREIRDAIAQLPGVVSVGFASDVPMGRPYNMAAVSVEGETNAAETALPLRKFIYISSGYFETMGTRMVAGRDVTRSELEAGSPVVVISENFAREFAMEPAAAVGRRIRRAADPQAPWHEVIGVAQNVHQHGLYQDPPRMVYWPGRVGQDVTFFVRSERAETSSFTEEIRQAVRSVNGSIPIVQLRTMQDFYAESLARTSFTLVLLTIAGAMALALGVVGIYGVIAYVVAQRTREIGIRSALGAEPRQVARMFLRDGLTLSAVGVVVGLVAAAALSRAMASLLFGIKPLDPVGYAAAIGIILTAAALATYVPARRAATIDPMETLRAE